MFLLSLLLTINVKLILLKNVSYLLEYVPLLPLASEIKVGLQILPISVLKNLRDGKSLMKIINKSLMNALTNLREIRDIRDIRYIRDLKVLPIIITVKLELLRFALDLMNLISIMFNAP